MKKIIIPIIVLLSCNESKAQQAFRNTGNLQIHPGGSLSGFGDFTNNSTSILLDSGSLYIRGNLTNDQASMAAGSGTLYLNGTLAQSVNGSQPFRTANLVTDNTAGILLNNNLQLTGVHTFTNGLISSSATPNYLVYEAGSSYAGNNDSRHVTGWIKKLGNTNFSFPVGSTSYQRSAAISNLSAVSEYNCHFYAPTQNLYNLSFSVLKVKANEYWQIDKISGGTAQFIFNWDHAKIPMDNVSLIDILATQYVAGSWTNAGGSPLATGNVTTTGTVTSNAFSTGGSFTIGYKSYPVPLTLISFKADRRFSTSYLHWVTENEEHVDHFDVERSYDAINYSAIGKITARNRSTREDYYFEDRSYLDGLAWYRIRSIDIDGKFKYSTIAVVSEKDLQSPSFNVLNPVQGAITIINRTGKSGRFYYSLFTSSGQLLLSGIVNMTPNGGAKFPVPKQTAAGIYLLELYNDQTSFKTSLLIQN